VRNWKPLVAMKCLVPCSKITVASGSPCADDVLLSVAGLNETEMNMLCRGNDSTEVKISLFGGQAAQQVVRVFSAICVAPIMNYAATHGFKYSLEPGSPWLPIAPSDSMIPFGYCRKTLPIRPEEEWIFIEERKAWQRISESGASRRYYQEVRDFSLGIAFFSLILNCFPFS
jgi:hypothetical protein